MRTRAAAAALSIVAVLPVAGCYQGFNQTVNDQGPSGNGTDLQVGPLLVQDTTIVAGDAGLRGALLMTVVNTGEADDALVAVQTDPASVSSLRQPYTEEPTNWSRRYKANLEKLASGDVIKVAEVVRDLWRRERERGLSAGEKRMLSKARQILVSELALAERTNEDNAEAILDEVLQS